MCILQGKTQSLCRVDTLTPSTWLSPLVPTMLQPLVMFRAHRFCQLNTFSWKVYCSHDFMVLIKTRPCGVTGEGEEKRLFWWYVKFPEGHLETLQSCKGFSENVRICLFPLFYLWILGPRCSSDGDAGARRAKHWAFLCHPWVERIYLLEFSIINLDLKSHPSLNVSQLSQLS